MTQGGEARVTALYRYPIKGFSAETLASVRLMPGETLPLDRAYAVENGPGHFDAVNPRHLPKIHFLMLMRNERLAALETEMDADRVLTIRREGRQVARGALNTPIGRQMVEQFLAAYLRADLRGAPRIVHAEGHSFTDKAEKCLHLVNLATLRVLQRTLERPLDPLRFRANVYFDCDRPWIEFDWLDREIAIGSARLCVLARTGRCEATNVEPGSGRRDMAIPAALMRAYGHSDVGVYARVIGGAEIRPGDRLGPIPPASDDAGADSSAMIDAWARGHFAATRRAIKR